MKILSNIFNCYEDIGDLELFFLTVLLSCPIFPIDADLILYSPVHKEF